MGFQDRPYYQQTPPPPGMGGMGGARMGQPGMWSFTTWLIVINVAVYVIDAMLVGVMKVGYEYLGRVMPPLEYWGHFSAGAIGHGQVWRFLTFQFLHSHASIMHLAFNMFALYMFGSIIERHLGSKRYLAFYLLCGVAGAAAYFLLLFTPLMSGIWVPMVGASAGVFGVLLGVATLAPQARVMLLFPPIPIKMQTLVYVFIAIAVFTVLTGGRNAGGEAAHLGGAALGWFLIRRPHLLCFADIFGGGPRGQGMLKGMRDARRERRSRWERDHALEVDRILDKVHRQGLGSLSEKEKRTLKKATDQRSGG